ncbi:hypothetical protein GLYMA_06G237750v4 [Glycine max]|nr:hypothetical protein GLYMA_06G237750v4 [Glycine max]KAH1127347.1 hypothetical protein GYH30_016075 [Glycine max]
MMLMCVMSLLQRMVLICCARPNLVSKALCWRQKASPVIVASAAATAAAMLVKVMVVACCHWS